MRGIERIEAPWSLDGSEGLLALIVRSETAPHGLNFYTEPDSVQQVATICHPKHAVIPDHVHTQSDRTIRGTPETLIVRKGKLQCRFYDSRGLFAASKIIGPGDVLILMYGGHGFTVLEDCDVVEVKQGPYLGAADKERLL